MIIKEAPGCLWFLGIFFAVIGTFFVYGSLGGYSNWSEASWWVIVLHFLGGCCAIAAGYWIIYRAPVTKVVIDRGLETVSFKRRGISRRDERTFRFDQIKQFCLIEKPDFDNDYVWALGLEMNDGEIIQISSLESTVEGFKRNFVFQANEFIYKQMPSYKQSELN